MSPTSPSDLATRDQLLQLLRYRARTVEELASAIGLTPNGIRAQLAVLERDGMVERQGVRHAEGPGKPPLLYAISARAEADFSAAYAPALVELVTVLRERLDPAELQQVFRTTGEQLAGARRNHGTDRPADQARALLESLGAAAYVTSDADAVVVEGVACPLADAVRRCPESCEMVRAMLAAATGSMVTTCCEYGDAPRCKFAIA